MARRHLRPLPRLRGLENEGFDMDEVSAAELRCRRASIDIRPSGASRPLRKLKNSLDFVLDLAMMPPVIHHKKKSIGMAHRTLHQAARDGDVSVMKYLLENVGHQIQQKINELDEDHLSPLHYAARYNFYEIVRLLVQKGASKRKYPRGGWFVSHAFCSKIQNVKSQKSKSQNELNYNGTISQVNLNDSSNVKLALYNRAKSFPIPQSNSQKPFKNILRSDSKDSFHQIRLGRIIRTNSLGNENCNNNNETKSVIHFMANCGAHVNCKDNFGLTPLHYAAMRGNEEAALELLFCKGINIEARDNQEMTPLHLAAIHGSTDIVQLLTESGANFRCCDKNRSTPLHKAAMEGHLDIVQLLLDTAEHQGGWGTVSQMVSDQDNSQNTALHLAAGNGHQEIVRLLIDKGADINVPRHNFMFPLHLAAITGDVEIVKLLVGESNSQIDCLNRSQETPLHRAAEYNQTSVMQYLLLQGANIESRDKDNFTPLLIASCGGHVEALQCLIHHGANIHAVDKNDKTAIHWAAEHNHINILEALQEQNCLDLLDRGDRYGNSPLHIASMKGYLGIVQFLLDQGAQIDSKNEAEQTPLHFAAKFGRTKVVKELVRRNKPIINDEDEDSNTSLHLAALFGHERAVQVLLNAGGNIEARNSHQWTALDCAASRGWTKTVRVLLEADSPIEPPDKIKTTPLHLAASRGHVEVVQLLLEAGADVSRRDEQGLNCLELAIEQRHKGVALVIVQSEYWKSALRNETINYKTRVRDTPMRMLIRKLPDVAEKVFYRCTSTTSHSSDHPLFAITFNYEFLDDMYTVFSDDRDMKVNFGDEEKDFNSDRLYSDDANVLKSNHPLMIMVNSRRQKLLSHPLCISLVHLKWEFFGRYMYYLNLLFYILFVVFLTGYVLSAPTPDMDDINDNVTDSELNAPDCDLGEQQTDGPSLFFTFGKFVIIVLAVMNLAKECFQIYQMRIRYVSLENLVEWVCFVTSLLLVTDFTECSQLTGVREPWQWQMAAMSIFLAWIDLLLFIRKFPFFGIYVVMFTYVFSTFVKAFSVLCLIIIAFAFGFYTVMHNQEQFETPWKSVVRTITMMLGEFQFDDIFDGDKLVFPIPSYILLTLFLMLTSIIMLNLLIGLAVDDIKEVQEQAELRRLAMQVELVLNVESLLPQCLRHRFVRNSYTILPNQSHLSFFRRILDKIANFEKNATGENCLWKVEKQPDIEMIHINQEEIQENLLNMRSLVRQVESQNQRLESILITLISHKGLHWEDEDEYNSVDST